MTNEANSVDEMAKAWRASREKSMRKIRAKRNRRLTPREIAKREALGIPVLAIEKPPKVRLKGRPSPYRGVTWNSRGCGWNVRMKIAGKSTTIGFFKLGREREAALAYDEAARRHFGAAAVLNFPKRGELGVRPRAARGAKAGASSTKSVEMA